MDVWKSHQSKRASQVKETQPPSAMRRKARPVQGFVPQETGISLARLYSRAQARKLVAGLPGLEGWRPATVYADGKDNVVKPKVRAAEVLWEKFHPTVFEDFRQRLFLALRATPWLSWQHLALTPVQLVRYPEHGFYSLHRDNRPGGTRRLSIVCYLNDDFDGGATAFPHHNLLIQPNSGMTALFDSELLHGSQPVTRGEKLVFVAWLGVSP